MSCRIGSEYWLGRLGYILKDEGIYLEETLARAGCKHMEISSYLSEE